MIWRLWCHGCPMEDHVLDVAAEQALEWVRFHQGHDLGGFVTPDDEPCVCGSDFTCLAAHIDGPGPISGGTSD